MFYEIEANAHVRVPPDSFDKATDKAVLERLNKDFENFVNKDLGIVVGVIEVLEIKEGIIIPGDGAAYYDTSFKILIFKPEMQEIVLGNISEITEFGAFINIGPIDGMIHISQTMDDYVSFSKSNALVGKESKKALKSKDVCRARVIAISYKEVLNPKIGLTMRQPALGNVKWIEEDLKKEKERIEKASKK
jgi:DNA-directed RNA polymerase subunit E'